MRRIVTLRVSADELARIDRAAVLQGLSRSEFIRGAALAMAGGSVVEEVEQRELPAPKPEAPSEPESEYVGSPPLRWWERDELGIPAAETFEQWRDRNRGPRL